jgi:hypothetical protein
MGEPVGKVSGLTYEREAATPQPIKSKKAIGNGEERLNGPSYRSPL